MIKGGKLITTAQAIVDTARKKLCHSAFVFQIEMWPFFAKEPQFADFGLRPQERHVESSGM